MKNFNTTFLFLIYFILNFFLIHLSSVDPVNNPKSWTPETLYSRLKETYLHPNNPNYKRNLQYMLFDPEFYLQEGNLQDAYNAMYTLYEKFNVSTHVFFISYMDEKYKTNEAFAAFVDRLSYLIYNNNDNYNENLTLTAVFFIKDRKMRIRTTKNMRKILTDDDCLNILNRRKKDLKNSNFEEVANGLLMDIFKTYSKNLQNPNGNMILLLTILFIIGMSIFVYLANREQPSVQEDKVKVFLDRCKKRANPKEIFAESCIICLEDFKSNDELSALESTNKKAFEKAETSVLDCGHKFHRKCIADWLKKEENCPICRMKFNLKPNENNANNKSEFSFDFSQILENILRVQSETNLLNRTEIRRIRRIYYPENNQYNNNNSRRNYNYSQNNYNYSQNNYNYSRSNDNYSTNSSYSDPRETKSYKEHNEGSGGASSDW